MARAIDEPLRFASFELDSASRELRRDGELLALEPRAFDLLHYLVRNRRRTVSKQELLRTLWPDADVGEGSLTSCVNRLRQVLGEDGGLIRTHYGRGYQFTGECDPDSAVHRSWAGLARAPYFVGRAAELQQLHDGCDRARSGSATIALVAGEQGIGKSRLVNEVLQRIAGSGMVALVGRCFEGEGVPAFWPWVQILRSYAKLSDADTLRQMVDASGAHLTSLVPELGHARLPSEATSDGATARTQLFGAVAAFLKAAAERGPLVIWIEDVHWIDTASLLLLRSLSRELANSAVLWILTYRPTEVADELSEVLSQLERSRGASRIHLTGLDADAAGQLIRSITPDESTVLVDSRAADVLQASAGNPFFIEQIVRHALETDEGQQSAVPATLQWIIERRIGRLSEGCRRFLAIAAVVGQQFDLPLVSRVRGTERAQSLSQSRDEIGGELEEAVAARMIETTGAADRFQFSHALLRQVIYQSQGAAERMRRHHRVAEAMEVESNGGAEVDVSEIAEHFVRGAACAPPAKAVEWISRSAAAAAGQFAFESAAHRYQQALALLPYTDRVDPRQEGHLLVSLARAQACSGDLVHAREAVERAVSLARQHSLGDLMGEAALACEIVVAQANTTEWYARVHDEALELLPATDSLLRARILGRAAWAHYYDPDRGVRRDQLSDAALAMARRLGDRNAIAVALLDRHRALMAPSHADDRLAIAEEMVALAGSIDSPDLLAAAEQQRAWDLAERGQMAEADEAMAHFGAVAERMHHALHRWSFLLWRGMRALLNGDWQESQQLQAQTYEFGKTIDEPFATLNFSSQFLTMEVMLGHLDGLAERLATIIPLYPRLVALPSAHAYVLAVQGRAAEARAAIDQCLSGGLESLPWDTTWAPTIGFLAMASAEISDRRRCEEIYAALEPYQDIVGLLGINAAVCYGSARRAMAAMAAALGRWDTSDQHFEAAIECNRRIGALPWLAYTSAEHARMLTARGRKSDQRRATERAREAASIAASLGMNLGSRASL